MAAAAIRPEKRVVTDCGGCLEGRTFVTLLAGDGDYWKGVVGLAKGLRRAKSAYNLVVAALPDVPEDHRARVVQQGCTVREIQPVTPPPHQGRSPFAWDYYVLNYSKLRMWEFVEYRKMVYLDADAQVFDNIDHLFDLPNGYFYAGKDCICGTPPCPEKVKWPPALGPDPPHYFNAGVFVFEPSFSTFSDLLETLQVTPPTAFAEQDFLNMYFKDVHKPLLPSYNLMVATLWRHPEEIELDKAKVVHCSARGSKPWRYTGKEENIRMLVRKWREIFDDETLDFNHKTAGGDGSVAAADDDDTEGEATWI